MTDPSTRQNISQRTIGADCSDAARTDSDVHRSIAADWMKRLRAALNDTMRLPPQQRQAWLMRNIEDAEEREAIATLLHAYGGGEIDDGHGG